MATFAKPENALKRAEELVNVGQKQAALEVLNDTIKSRKYRSWQKPLERIMFKYVELCVDIRNSRSAKDGLIQYRIACQQVNVASLEDVIKHFMQLSTERAEQARSQAKALDDALDVEDLEADRRPEDLMLSYVSGEKGKDRSDRELVTPWFKFLWETYRTVLEILRTNSKLETLYAMTAHRAFQFCKQYKRSTEFRRLCEIIRNHLANMNKNQSRDQRDRPDLTIPESLQLYLDTRVEQLRIATDLELWQEAFRSVEDIYGLMSMVKKSPKASVMVTYYAKMTEIFWVSHSHLYHAYAWLKLFTLQKSYNKNLTQKDLQSIASSVLLATLAVMPYDNTYGLSHSELENEKEHNLRMASLINFNFDLKRESRVMLSRSSLLSELVAKGVMTCVSQEVKDLYNLLEYDFFPLDLASRVQPLLTRISKLGGKLTSASSVPEVQLRQYIPSLEKLATLRGLQQASKVFQTMKIDMLSSMIPFFDFSALEKISVDAVKYNFIAMKVDHLKGAVIFGNMDVESDELCDHLSSLAECLDKARGMITPTEKQLKPGNNLIGLADIVEKEHKRLLARKTIIEKRKEEHERHMLEQEREDETNRLKLQRVTEEAEQKRRATEYSRREEQRIRREIEEKELLEAQQLLLETEKRGKKKGKKLLLEGEKVTKQALLDLAISEQLRERQEMEKKLQKLGKTMDHLQRAKREEEAPLTDQAFQQCLVQEQLLYQMEQEKEIDLSRQRHEDDLREKHRLFRILDSKNIFGKMIMNRREAEYNKQIKEKQDSINQIKESKRHGRETRRRVLCFLKTEQERLTRLEEEKEARQHEEAERRRREEAEKKAKLDEVAEKQRQREREIEEKREKERRPPAPVASSESSLPAAPASGKYVPRFRRSGAEPQPAAPSQPEADRRGRQESRPEADKWGRQDNRTAPSTDRYNRPSSFGSGSRPPPPSSSTWSSSRSRQ